MSMMVRSLCNPKCGQQSRDAAVVIAFSLTNLLDSVLGENRSTPVIRLATIDRAILHQRRNDFLPTFFDASYLRFDDALVPNLCLDSAP